MRFALMGIALLGVSACAPEVPESGVGFDSYQSYSADRDAQLQGLPPPSTLPPSTGFDPARVGAAIDAAEQGTTLPQSRAAAACPCDRNRGACRRIGGARRQPAPRQRTCGHRRDDQRNGRRGIARHFRRAGLQRRRGARNDRERRRADCAEQGRSTRSSPPRRCRRARAIPQPVLVEYALSTTNGVGEQVYTRSGIRLSSYDAACKRYRSPDLAQEAFLGSGGPRRDPKGLDPDGDGFACAWDPRPFRAALQ